VSDVSPATALILVDHGSRFQGANDMLLDVVEMVRRLSGLTRVYPAHMELAEPSIRQAFERASARVRRPWSSIRTFFPRSTFHHGYSADGGGGGEGIPGCRALCDRPAGRPPQDREVVLERSGVPVAPTRAQA